MQKAIYKTNFSLDDFRSHLANRQKMGMKDLIGKIPGLSEMIPDWEVPEDTLRRVQRIMDSMTNQERLAPEIIDLSRRERIAAGCGVQPLEVRQFLKQFDFLRRNMEYMLSMSSWQRIKMMAGFGKIGPLQTFEVIKFNSE